MNFFIYLQVKLTGTNRNEYGTKQKSKLWQEWNRKQNDINHQWETKQILEGHFFRVFGTRVTKEIT